MDNAPQLNVLQTAVDEMEWQCSFMQWLRGGGRSHATIATYVNCVAIFVAWFEQTNGQPFNPGLLTSWDARAFRAWSLEVARCAPATWDLRRAALTMLARWGQAYGWLAINPMEDVKPAERVEDSPRWLTDAEFGRLMRYQETAVNAANTPQRQTRAFRDAAMVGLMVYGCLREGEVAGLLMEDVKAGERKGLVVIRQGKGGKYREVPLSSEALRSMRAWLVSRGVGPNEALFVDENGEVISTRAIQKRVTAMGQACQVEGLTPHRLRHTGAKRMVDAGRPLSEVQRILGHSRLETTMRYVMAGWEDLEEAVESISLGSMRRGR